MEFHEQYTIHCDIYDGQSTCHCNKLATESEQRETLNTIRHYRTYQTSQDTSHIPHRIQCFRF